jgi:GNAT superfamily N-acetyltransferase
MRCSRRRGSPSLFQGVLSGAADLVSFDPAVNITLRDAIASDLEWLDSFHESLMRPYVELTHVWDKSKFRQSFNPTITSIIQYDRTDIGMLKVEASEDCIDLGDIQISREFQGRGIGTHLVKQVLERANQKRIPVRLRVLKGNPVKELYVRLGFQEVRELNNCYELEKKAEPSG